MENLMMMMRRRIRIMRGINIGVIVVFMWRILYFLLTQQQLLWWSNYLRRSSSGVAPVHRGGLSVGCRLYQTGLISYSRDVMDYKRLSTNSSGGLSAQLLGESNSSYEPEDDQETASISFFVDVGLLCDLNLKSTALEEANSHLVLLEVTENDPALRRSTLLDGRTIDFLFGNDTKRSFPVKRYLRCLHEQQQDMAVRFYHQTYDAIMDYHSNLRGYGICACCVLQRLRIQFEERLGCIFRDFLADLSSHQSTGLIDDI